MLHIERFQVNMLQENCYVVSDETKECVIIDCGAFYPEERTSIVNYIKENELKPVHLLVTHGHLDHNFGNNTIRSEARGFCIRRKFDEELKDASRDLLSDAARLRLPSYRQILRGR